MNRRIRVLFIRHSTSSFIQQDLELLRKHFDVKIVYCVLGRKPLRDTLKTILGILNGTLWADVAFTWFAGLHSALAVLFAKIFRKKTITVAGGYDVAAEPEVPLLLSGTSKIRRLNFEVRYALENIIRDQLNFYLKPENREEK